MSDHVIGDLAEVLDNLGVFGAHPEDLAELCPTGFRRIAIQTGPDYYISLQAFGPNQTAYAHTHPDSEEWVVILGGAGEAYFGPTPVPLHPGVVVGRGGGHPHGFRSADEPMYLLSIQLPRPVRPAGAHNGGPEPEPFEGARMTDKPPEGPTRIDRITAPEFVRGLPDLSLNDL